VPLLGDIPGIGELFKDTSKASTNSTLYVFLTPKIMTDPNFYDLKLLSEGPRASAELDPDAPALEPVIIRSLPARAPTGGASSRGAAGTNGSGSGG
jgi:type II secretory pathway component GspD/PulD (secretin)